MTFLEAKKIVEGKGYHVVKNSEGESFRQRVAREELEEAKRVTKRAGYRIINEDEETPYETALMDKKFTNFVASISNDNDYDTNEEKYASWVDTLVNEQGWDVYDAIDHVISKNWSEYYDEILDRALDNDDISTEEAERIADLVATPLSGIDYEEVLADPSLYKDEDIDESCCCGGKKKKGKKKGKKSGFVPFWARKKDKVDESYEDDLDLEGMTLDEGFGTAGGTPLSQLCEEYIRDGYFIKLASEIGLEAAKTEFLEKARKVTGDKYFRTLTTRIQAAKTPNAVLFVIQGTMFGGSNMDLAAGTRQSAYHRNRR
ncbi:MAG: hypothetical protein IJF83_08200 [Methanobrevibacter sp.]|nr:hypothetical protein [Methanobrevibacter sp.]